MGKGKLAVLIPSRNERYLNPTIDDCVKKAAGEVEVIVTLEGYWPSDWGQVSGKYANLHTIHHGEPRGLRAAINSAANSAISRGAKYLFKLDAHCKLDEGYDEKLKADMDHDWIVIPRRKRLDAENWTIQDVGKPDVDYHYLSFPNNPQDFGGPGLNGKVWDQRIRERLNKPEYDIDDELSSQGSAWGCHAAYFTKLELMDEGRWGPFWCEAQEVLMKAWLSGGRCVINKKTWYAHLHKGRTYTGEDGKGGRGYHLDERWLKMGRDQTMKWVYNEAWQSQIKPFKWLIDHFWPVPSWPENWEEVLYARRKPRALIAPFRKLEDSDMVRVTPDSGGMEAHIHPGKLTIHAAAYGVEDDAIDVTERVRELAKNGTLDAVVNNSTLMPGQNPFRGRKKSLTLTYSFDDGEHVVVTRSEKDWLIIGPVTGGRNESSELSQVQRDSVADQSSALDHRVITGSQLPLTATALNDYLIRRFSISPQRLRGPMPIELRDFHRDDLAQLFAELGFKRGAEIGVAEGNYSEILLKANPECELLLVDPWHHYSDNPQGKSKEKHEFAFNETLRKTKPYPNIHIRAVTSMEQVVHEKDNSLDFVYLDAHHSYPFIMEDLINWTRKVRPGGIVALDDIYKLNEKWGAGPMEAIYDYTRAMRINPWWLINAHKSVDAFFVKL